MPSITEDTQDPAKILMIGKSGAGKTGALASLVAAGYNLRIIDTDNGARPLRSLLTDEIHYPYAKLIKAKGIDLSKAVRVVKIDTAMKVRSIVRRLPGEGNKTTTETLIAPEDAKAWLKAADLLDKWKEGDVDFGPVSSWGPQDVLVYDTFGTLAKCAYYFCQAMNGRLGARDQGFDYQRDVGEAQAQLTRLLELISGSRVPCNVIIITHITWVDESRGIASRPKDGDLVMANPDGLPSAIGRALSPQMGKYFNDVYIVRSSGSGSNVTRTISTVPQDGVLAKNSVYLERDYPVSYGLASIFSSLRFQPQPTDLIEACKPRREPAPSPSASSPLPQARPTPVAV
jgi:hypothetical protein